MTVVRTTSHTPSIQTTEKQG
ncbi:hypothetical protein A2U01_0088597, partial [Trifolium medium]|nr:hypothetical protein [Trifolium medium]